MQKIVILTADAGFGHRSAANAIYDGLVNHAQIPLSVEIINLLDAPGVPKAFSNTQSEYDKIVKSIPKIYEFGYTQSDRTVPANLGKIGFSAVLYRAYDEMIQTRNPDVIISTYPFYQAPAQTWSYINEETFKEQNVSDVKAEIEKELPGVFNMFTTKRRPHIPYITVTTDFISLHQLWMSKMPDIYTVANEDTKKIAVEYGIDPNRVVITGIPVKPIFSLETRSKPEIRESLGWELNRTTVIAIGSKRVSKLVENLCIIDHSGFDFQLIMIAGGDDKLYREMRKTEWHHPVQIYNFTSQMPEMLLASDVAITKSGGLITSECLAAGLPMLLIDVLPGQEEGNANLVTTNRAGILTGSPTELLEAFFHLMTNDQAQLKRMSLNAKKIGRPRASLDVCDIILYYLKKQNDAQNKPQSYKETN